MKKKIGDKIYDTQDSEEIATTWSPICRIWTDLHQTKESEFFFFYGDLQGVNRIEIASKDEANEFISTHY